MPQRGAAKKTLFCSNNTDNETDGDRSGDRSGDTSGSSDYTIILESNDDLSEDSFNAGVC